MIKMVMIDGKDYRAKYPINPENAEYNSALIYYINIQEEIKDLGKSLNKYKKTIKKLGE